jgi:hypothetical protein
MAAYLVLGAGHFGRLALARLSQAEGEARFTMVDHSAAALAAAAGLAVPRVQLVQAEAVSWLAAHLPGEARWDWLVPMVPVHAAAGWLRRGPWAGTAWRVAPVPEEVASLAPTARRGPAGELYLSRAAHLCPDDCAEPDFCPVTGEPREPSLARALEELRLPGAAVVVMKSRQLAPGVGGYPPQDLLDAAETLAAGPGRALVATACRCHGVAHFFRKRGRQS